MIVTLEKLHIDFADKVGRKRQAIAVQYDYAPHNGAPDDPETALRMHIGGARCEAAGKLYLNPVTWNLYNPKEPDFEGWIDAKGIEKSHHRLIVQEDDPDEWAYLLIFNTHPTYKMLGWCWGYEAKQKQFWDDPVGGRPAYFVPSDDLIIRLPTELFAEVRKRQRPFEHFCHCGKWGAFGYRVDYRNGKLGDWYCMEHRPK